MGQNKNVESFTNVKNLGDKTPKKSMYHLSILAIMATFSVGICSNVAQCDASVRFCFKIGSHLCGGDVMPCN